MDNIVKSSNMPLTFGIACVIYALFIAGSFSFYGFQYANVNIETAILSFAFFFCPLLTVVGLIMKTRLGWYSSIILPVLYFCSAIVLRLLAFSGIGYRRWSANYSQEYFFCGRDGLEFLASCAFWSAVILTPAVILLFTRDARSAIFQHQSAKK